MLQNSLMCPCCNQPVDAAFIADPYTLIVTNGIFTAKLTPRQFAVAKVLIDAFPKRVTKEEIYDRVFLAPNGDGPEIKIVDVMICKIRPPLAEIGLVIDTVWGVGYRLIEEDKTKANDIRDASIRLREKGTMHMMTPEREAELIDLMRRKFTATGAATIMNLPYMTVERAMKRLQSQTV